MPYVDVDRLQQIAAILQAFAGEIEGPVRLQVQALDHLIQERNREIARLQVLLAAPALRAGSSETRAPRRPDVVLWPASPAADDEMPDVRAKAA